MNLRKLSLSAAALAALVPSLSFAGGEDHALQACANAFASSLSAGNFRLNYARTASSPLSDYYAHEYTFTLHANDAKTHAPLASASCSATVRGTVLSMRTTGAPSDGVKFAAR